ncbi:MAG: 2-oxo acid dehydrogenase subunit E2 [Ignavibacteria bacterium]
MEEVRSHKKSLPDFNKWGETEIQQMTKVRAITAETMNYAWSSIPMVTQFDKADITQLEVFRKKNIKKVESAGGNPHYHFHTCQSL